MKQASTRWKFHFFAQNPKNWQNHDLYSFLFGTEVMMCQNKTGNPSKDALEKDENCSNGKFCKMDRLTWVTRLTWEARCENCQMWEIANLISARDANASGNHEGWLVGVQDGDTWDPCHPFRTSLHAFMLSCFHFQSCFQVLLEVNIQDYQVTNVSREALLKKKMFSFGHCPKKGGRPLQGFWHTFTKCIFGL